MKLSPYSESGMERVSFDDGVRPRSARLSVFLARQSPAKNGLFFRLAGRKAEGSAPLPPLSADRADSKHFHEVLMELQEKAYAKLNLSLDVGGKRADGYHEMNMVMQTVSLCDELQISTTDDGTLRARSNLRFIPSDERNLAVKAARVFLEAAGEGGQGLLITLRKNIPVGAGMAGGSSDADPIRTICGSPSGTGRTGTTTRPSGSRCPPPPGATAWAFTPPAPARWRPTASTFGTTGRRWKNWPGGWTGRESFPWRGRTSGGPKGTWGNC